ncbi:hypothetical protein CRYUN_Cryun16bG0133000 [Craigia yunnanensis]
MQSTTVGAKVIPARFGSSGSDEIMYMRANYKHVVGNADSESFHFVNPNECTGQELSVFLMRSRSCCLLVGACIPLADIRMSALRMLEGKAVVRETDMPEEMQSRVMELAYQAPNLHEVSDCQSIAHWSLLLEVA